MRHKQLKLSVVLLLCLGLTGLQAQESINANGGNATGSGATVSFSIGQVMYQNHNGSNGSVGEGVQQAYEISIISGIDEAKDIYLSVSAYPNPTTDCLTLKINEFEITNLSYQMYDIQGRLLQSEQIKNGETIIVMSNFVSATYFVKVFNENKEIKTFKIIKN